MAFVTSVERADRKTLRVQPTQVTCLYIVDEPARGQKLIQFDTHGSYAREMPGKVSQTLQFDEARARQLWEILGREFGFK